MKKITSPHKSLRQTEARLLEAQSIAKLALFEIDFRDGSALWSDELYLRYGFEIDEFTPTLKNLFELIHTDDKDRVQDALEAFRQSNSGEVMEVEYRISIKGKDETHIYTTFIPEKDKTGQTIRCRCVSQDITERKQAQEKLHKHQQVDKVVSKLLSSYFKEQDLKASIDGILSTILELTESDYGFIGEVLFDKEDLPYLKTYALTNIAWDDETRRFYDENASDGLEFRNLKTLFGAAMTSKELVISNDRINDPRSGGIPEGHPPLNSFLGIPFIHDEKLIGMLGIANRPDGFNEEIAEMLAPVISACISVITYINARDALSQKETALIDKNKDYQTLFETSREGISFVDLDGQIRLCNDAYCNLLGYSLEELQTMSYQQVTPGKWHAIEAKIVEEKIFKEGYSGEFETRLTHKDGTEIPVALRAWLVKDDEGNPKQIMGLISDITKRKQTEEQIRESEKQLLDAQRMAKVGSWDWDKSSDTVHWSDEAYRIYGVSRHDKPVLTREYIKAVIHPDDLERIYTNVDRTVESGIGNNNEYRIVRPDGSVRTVSSRREILKDKDGNVTGLAGTVHDITERKQAEAELKESEERYALAMKGANDGLWDWNLLTDEVHLSPRWKSMLGYAENEIKDEFSEWERLLHPDDKDRAQSNARGHLEGKSESYNIEFRMLHKDGHYIDVLARAFAVEDEAGNKTRLVGTHVDITKPKKAAAELKESEERYALAMKGANDGLWDRNLLTNEVYFSPRWKSMLGYAENEIKNETSEAERLVHPDDKDRIESDVAKFIEGKSESYNIEFRMLHKDGHYIDVLARAFAVEDEAGNKTRLVGTHVDVTKRKKAEAELNHQSSHDSLTGLVNRREFEDRTERLLATSKAHSQHHALCYMDLDQFKVVNDTCGHAAGDELLRQLGEVLQKVIRHRDTLARLGGDEFGVLMEHCSLEASHRVATSIQTAIQDYQFLWEGRSFRVGVSMGLVAITDTTLNMTELFKDADAACYMAKEKGRNRIHVHRGDDTELAQRHGEMQWVNRLQQAFDENRFCLYAQSIESLDDSTGVHYELLIRMRDEEGEIIPPGAFLPAAERYNLITQVDRWVVKNTFRLLTENPAFFEQINFISINLSGQSLTDETFLGIVVQLFHEHEIEAEKICFEITETAAISNLSMANRFITELRAIGCRFALDDFGSGLSSFAYLKNLPVDYLKIDGMFVKGIVDDPIDHAMVKSINEIGHVMGMQTIAEFVENDEIKDMLTKIGINYAQGYAIGKPRSFDELLGELTNVTDINKSEKDEVES